MFLTAVEFEMLPIWCLAGDSRDGCGVPHHVQRLWCGDCQREDQWRHELVRICHSRRIVRDDDGVRRWAHIRGSFESGGHSCFRLKENVPLTACEFPFLLPLLNTLHKKVRHNQG